MSRSALAGMLAVFLGLSLGACATSPSQEAAAAPRPQSAYIPPGERADLGRRFAERTCARCHAIAGVGPSPNSAAPPFAVLASRYDIVTLGRKLDDIATGHYDMPPTRVSDDEIESLTAYLQTFSQH